MAANNQAAAVAKTKKKSQLLPEHTNLHCVGLYNEIHSEVASCLALPRVPVFCGAVDQELKLFDESRTRSTNRSDVDRCEAKIDELLQNTDISYLNLKTDADQERYNSVDIHIEHLRHNGEAFDCGAPGVMRSKSAFSLSFTSSFSVPSNGHVNDFGFSESSPHAKNISTSDHNQQHESYCQRDERREKICRKMSSSSIKVCRIAQEDSSGSKQPCKKQKVTSTTPAQPTPPSPAHRIDEQGSDVSSDKEEDESDDKESKYEVEEVAYEENSNEQQLPLEENLKGQDPWESGVNRKAGDVGPSNGHINDVGSGSIQSCKKRNITTTTPAQPTPPSPAHRIDEQSSDVSSNKEEDESDDKESKDEVVEDVDEVDSDELQLPPEENLKGQNPWKSDVNRKAGKNVPLALTLTDQDVFDCPVCFEKLTNNVYQCKNGHVACDSCCGKINKTCPTCLCPIEYRCRAFEKVLEAIQVPCVNAEHGCRQVISYCKIRDHEDLCAYLPCSCPIRKCDFKGTDSNLYQHFAEKHKAVNFRFRYRVSVSITREKKLILLRETASGTLFVVKLFSVPQGNAISVVLIGPKSYSGNYRYELTAKDDGVTPPVEMHSPVESVPSLADYRPTRYFLVVGDGISQLNFDIRIRPNQ